MGVIMAKKQIKETVAVADGELEITAVAETVEPGTVEPVPIEVGPVEPAKIWKPKNPPAVKKKPVLKHFRVAVKGHPEFKPQVIENVVDETAAILPFVKHWGLTSHKFDFTTTEVVPG